MARIPRFAIAVAVTGVLAAAPAAQATDYCVAPNTTCGGMNVTSFEAALGAADDNNNSDRVFLGAATYTAPAASGYFYGLSSGPLEIIGAGIGETVLTAQIGALNQVLYVDPGAGSSIHDLTVRLPQNVASGFTGMRTFADVADVDVVEAPSQSNQPRRGIDLEGGDATRVSVSLAGSNNTLGILMAQGGEVVSDSLLVARTAVSSNFGGSVQRSVLRAAGTGLAHIRQILNVTDSLIVTTSNGATGIYVDTQAGTQTTMNADGVTLVERGSNSSAVFVSNSADAQIASANLVDTVIRGFSSSMLTIDGHGAGAANITTSYSDYDPTNNADLGTTGSITQTNRTNLGDARFVDAANDDYRLRHDSPLIDIGEPVDPTTTVDLGGGLRLVDGDQTGGARRDIGAFEYQARAPSAAISGPSTGSTTEQLSFSGAGSSDPDPGDTLTYAWTLDGAPAGTGATLNATVATAGAHTIGLTVSDPVGRSASTTASITIAALPGAGEGGTPPPPPPPPADIVRPVISNLTASPARVRRGLRVTFRFTLSEAAAVRVEIQRARPGRRQGGRCRKPSRRNRSGQPCKRFVRVALLQPAGTVGANSVRFATRVGGRAMPAGAYRAVVKATDAAGNRAVVRRVSFTIRRR